MASIFKRPSGSWTVEMYIGGEKRKIGLATKSRREAERTAERIQILYNSRLSGVENLDSVAWLAKVREMSPKLYKKLVVLGLADSVDSGSVKTIAVLHDAYMSQAVGISVATKKLIEHSFRALFDFFSPEFPLEKITAENAEKFMVWLRSPDAFCGNKRGSLAENTVARRTVRFRGFFAYAVRLGWIKSNPFIGIRTKPTPAFARWRYFSMDDFLEVLSATESPKMRVILCLGRLAGCRGVSEMHNLTWQMIDFGDNPSITFRASKKRGKEDELRTVPMGETLRRELMKYRESVPGEKVFPGMHLRSSFRDALLVVMQKAGFSNVPDPWYNQRRSFCSDIMQSGVDPKLYEAVCGHGFETGMRHYQILHPERQKAGFEKIRLIFGDKTGDKTHKN